uniref:PGG domain-containing protein n=1 Tax=Chenopodium quinoa TaxID=63459 RepID=A0A803KWQ4_CHEQI
MTSPVCRRARGRVESKLKDLGCYLPLYKAVIKGDWNEVRKFLDEDPEALMAKITIESETALHIAVGTGKHLEFVEKLIRRMSPEDLALTDQNGDTPLSVAAAVGNDQAAKLLVSKNPELPNISGKSGLPLHRAAQYGHEKMISYLLEVTRNDMESYIALGLVEKYPEMATAEVHGMGSPLSVLARKSNVFPSGADSWWKIFIRYHVKILKFIKQLRRRDKMQHDALELVKSLCSEILELDDAKAFSLLQQPLLIAARLGTHEIIEEIVDVFPSAIWASDEENHNMFQLAVLHRRENVFNLIYQMSEYKNLITRHIDNPDNNNILHLAGKLPSLDRLNRDSGAALQVQRELKWFKEVKKYVQPGQKEAMNKDGKTPWMVFGESHEKLMKDGEKWMKATAQSCTVAATLIATVAFNAGLKVPGGDSNDGLSQFFNHTAFGVFAVADAISLFSSVSTILVFLLILTSRYSEEDFRLILPAGLFVGMTMLFISIISMMVAFGSAIYLVFGPHRAKVVIPVGSALVLPFTLYVLLRPLYHMIKYKTIGPSIFGKQSDRELH